MSTACEMAKVDPPQNLDSVSFLPTLKGKPESKTVTNTFTGNSMSAHSGRPWFGKLETHPFRYG